MVNYRAELANDMRKNMFELISDLSSIFTRSTDLSDLEQIRLTIELVDDETLLEKMTESFLPFKKQIADRDLIFFKNNKNKIFVGIDQEKVNHFDHRITSPPEEGGISNEDKDTIWDYFDVMIMLAEKTKSD
jgi:hypothetical protein